MRISDWSSDVCSSDLPSGRGRTVRPAHHAANGRTIGNGHTDRLGRLAEPHCGRIGGGPFATRHPSRPAGPAGCRHPRRVGRSEEHTSELQSLMRLSYAVFCLKKKNIKSTNTHNDKTQ